MYIQQSDVERILEIMQQFPDAQSFQLKQHNASGIGSILSMTITTRVNGLDGEFTVEISGVENW